MRKPLPILAAAAVIVAACSAGGTDTMAELMRDGGAMLADAGRALMDAAAGIDAAGTADARASTSDGRAAPNDATHATPNDGRAPDTSQPGSPADSSAQPVKAPPRALEAPCSLTQVTTATATATGAVITTTTSYYAQFDVSDIASVREAHTCDPLSSPVAFCPQSVPSVAYSCTGFSPSVECTSGWFFSSGGKIYVSCGSASSVPGPPVTNIDTHYRRARLLVD